MVLGAFGKAHCKFFVAGARFIGNGADGTDTFLCGAAKIEAIVRFQLQSQPPRG